jgi:hypothetical protein
VERGKGRPDTWRFSRSKLVWFGKQVFDQTEVTQLDDDGRAGPEVGYAVVPGDVDEFVYHIWDA